MRAHQRPGGSSYAGQVTGVPEEVRADMEKRNHDRKQRRKDRNSRISVLDAAITAALADIGEDPRAAKRVKPDGRTPNGRAFHAVLADVIRYLTHLREHPPPEGVPARAGHMAVKMEPEEPEEPSDASGRGHIHFREGLLACEGMLCIEVHVPSWRISALGAGAKRFFEHAPWRLRSPQSLLHLVHCGDVESFQGMLKQAEAYGVSFQTPVRLQRFHLVRAQLYFLITTTHSTPRACSRALSHAQAYNSRHAPRTGESGRVSGRGRVRRNFSCK